MHTSGESKVQGELHKRKHGDGKECGSVNQSRSPCFLFKANDEQNSRRERKHGGCHREESKVNPTISF